MARRCLHPEDYTVGWVCALPVELAAAAEMLDEVHQDLRKDDNDTNLYTLGRIGEHNVVVACLPVGQKGTSSAAAVAVQMKSKFVSIRFGLMVGTGGGVPSASDIRLGDVVVSQPYMEHGGVIQYDFGKTTPSGFVRTGFLNTPPTLLLNAVAKLQANHLRGKTNLSAYLSALNHLPEFARENVGLDILFESTYNHVGGPTCEMCSKDRIIERTSRGSQEIVVHYGTIASGNQVIKDGITRDKVSSELGGVLCFEMEAAGLMNSFPCLVIRGICDYADSHKNKRWHAYAAAAAAACAKEVLSVIPAAEVVKTCTIRSSMPTTGGQIPIENQSSSSFIRASWWVASLISHTVIGIVTGIFTGRYAVDSAYQKSQGPSREADSSVNCQASGNPNENDSPSAIGSITSEVQPPISSPLRSHDTKLPFATSSVPHRPTQPPKPTTPSLVPKTSSAQSSSASRTYSSDLGPSLELRSVSSNLSIQQSVSPALAYLANIEPSSRMELATYTTRSSTRGTPTSTAPAPRAFTSALSSSEESAAKKTTLATSTTAAPIASPSSTPNPKLAEVNLHSCLQRPTDDQGRIRMDYQWDRVPLYRLNYTIVNKFLTELFGNYDFYTQVSSSQGLLRLKGDGADYRRVNISISTITSNSGSLEP